MEHYEYLRVSTSIFEFQEFEKLTSGIREIDIPLSTGCHGLHNLNNYTQLGCKLKAEAKICWERLQELQRILNRTSQRHFLV